MLWNILTAGHATILRLPCLQYANFKILYNDKVLQGYVIHRAIDTNDVQCTEKCIQHEKCRSYNINRDLKICELNAKALSDVDIQLSDKPGWIYKSTDHREKLVCHSMSFYALK